jgi:hypothetical protein
MNERELLGFVETWSREDLSESRLRLLEVEGLREAAESCKANRIAVNMGEQVGIERERSWERSRMEEHTGGPSESRNHHVGGEDG